MHFLHGYHVRELWAPTLEHLASRHLVQDLVSRPLVFDVNCCRYFSQTHRVWILNKNPKRGHNNIFNIDGFFWRQAQQQGGFLCEDPWSPATKPAFGYLFLLDLPCCVLETRRRLRKKSCPAEALVSGPLPPLAKQASPHKQSEGCPKSSHSS